VQGITEGNVSFELRNFQLTQRQLGLAHIKPGARPRNGELHLHSFRQGCSLHFTSELQSFIGSTQTPFAVHHQRQLVIRARKPAIGAKLAKGEGKVTQQISGDAHRFTGNRNPARFAGSGQRVLVGSLGIIINDARGHHQMSGDPLRVFLGECFELSPRRAF